MTEAQRKEYIDRVDNYVGSTGKKYKSHYHTILSWHRKDYPIKKEINKVDENPFLNRS